MRSLKLIIACICILAATNLFSQEIVKRVKNFVLITINESSGCVPGDELTVLRKISELKIINIGTVKIIKFAQGQCAAQVTAQKKGFTVGPGDFIEIPVKDEHIPQKQAVPKPAAETGSIGLERGDSELSFMGFYAKIVGTEMDMPGIGSFKLAYGYFVTRNIQIGAEPQLLIYPGFMGGTDTIFSFSLYGSYNFLTGSKFIPYVTVKWYQDEVVPGDDLLEDAYVTFGGGFRNFFNEYAALNTSITYGFNLGGMGETVFTIMSGVSFIF